MNKYEWWNGGGCLVECEPLCIVYLCALHKHGLLCPAVVHCVVCVLSFIDSYVRRWNAWSPTVFSSLKCITTYHILYDLASKTYSCATNAPSISLRRLMPGKKMYTFLPAVTKRGKSKENILIFYLFYVVRLPHLGRSSVSKRSRQFQKRWTKHRSCGPKKWWKSCFHGDTKASGWLCSRHCWWV